MSDDFAIFILSHNRARNIDTLSMLKKYHYSGTWYVVVSTDNKQLEEYKSLIPKDNLLIFDKSEYLHVGDTMVSSYEPEWSSAVYARNFIFKKAKELNLECFVMADDDIERILFRYERDGKMGSKEIDSIDDVLLEVRDFLFCSEHIGGLCFAFEDGYFGGLKGNFARGLTRRIFQFMMFKTSETWEFMGVRCEDYMISFRNISRLFFAIWGCSISSPKMMSNSGGIEYEKDRFYEPSFPYVMSPSGVAKLNNKRTIQENKLLPKIISSKYKRP